VGRLDVVVEALAPVDARVAVLGASSDTLIDDATRAPELRVGGELAFDLGYAALVAAMDSPHVEKRFQGGA
jgi:predicted amino acid racemase